MPPQESGSSLSSVIGSHSKDLTEWGSKQVRSDRPLARFHAKFWGKSMVDEEQEWLNTQPTTTEDQHTDDHMEVDSGEVIDPEDGIAVGCYVLDIGIEGIDHPSIWVRADFIRLYDALENFSNNTLQIPGRAPSAVFTGQPGIGKSVWVYYALRRRLAEKKPVMWYQDQTCYLFVEGGVYEAPPTFKPSYYKVFVWTLVDSDESMEGPPSLLTGHGTRLYVIYITSPAKKRLEIYRAAPLRLYNPNFQLIDEMYDQLGPTPRLCLETSQPEDLEKYKKEVHRALRQLTVQGLEDLVDTSEDLYMDAVSHKLCLIKRADPNNARSSVQVIPITDYIASKIALHICNYELKDQVRLYKNFSSISSARGMTGNVFEAFCQGLFQSSISIQLLPMVRLDGNNETKRRPRWHTSHYALPNKELEKRRLEALLQSVSLNMHPSDVVEYCDSELEGLHILPDVYYMPRKSNEVALDAFIIHDGFLYIFQFTGGKTHCIKAGLIPLLAKCAQLPPRDRWRFIFVIPDDSQLLRCPYSQNDQLQGLQLFSSIVKVEHKQG